MSFLEVHGHLQLNHKCRRLTSAVTIGVMGTLSLQADLLAAASVICCLSHFAEVCKIAAVYGSGFRV